MSLGVEPKNQGLAIFMGPDFKQMAPLFRLLVIGNPPFQLPANQTGVDVEFFGFNLGIHSTPKMYGYAHNAIL
jgi:hypothetical protein